MLDVSLAIANTNAVHASTNTVSSRAELAYYVQKNAVSLYLYSSCDFYNHSAPSLVMFSKPWSSRECDMHVLFRAKDFTVFLHPDQLWVFVLIPIYCKKKYLW